MKCSLRGEAEENHSISFREALGSHSTKGEQTFNSYGDRTPEIYRDYGFLEELPRRWSILGPGVVR